MEMQIGEFESEQASSNWRPSTKTLAVACGCLRRGSTGPANVTPVEEHEDKYKQFTRFIGDLVLENKLVSNRSMQPSRRENRFPKQPSGRMRPGHHHGPARRKPPPEARTRAKTPVESKSFNYRPTLDSHFERRPALTENYRPESYTSIPRVEEGLSDADWEQRGRLEGAYQSRGQTSWRNKSQPLAPSHKRIEWERQPTRGQSSLDLQASGGEGPLRAKNHDERPIKGMDPAQIVSNYYPELGKEPGASTREFQSKFERLRRKWVSTKKPQRQSGKRARKEPKRAPERPIQIIQQINIKHVKKHTIKIVSGDKPRPPKSRHKEPRREPTVAKSSALPKRPTVVADRPAEAKREAKAPKAKAAKTDKKGSRRFRLKAGGKQAAGDKDKDKSQARRAKALAKAYGRMRANTSDERKKTFRNSYLNRGTEEAKKPAAKRQYKTAKGYMESHMKKTEGQARGKKGESKRAKEPKQSTRGRPEKRKRPGEAPTEAKRPMSLYQSKFEMGKKAGRRQDKGGKAARNSKAGGKRERPAKAETKGGKGGPGRKQGSKREAADKGKPRARPRVKARASQLKASTAPLNELKNSRESLKKSKQTKTVESKKTAAKRAHADKEKKKQRGSKKARVKDKRAKTGTQREAEQEVHKALEHIKGTLEGIDSIRKSGLRAKTERSLSKRLRRLKKAKEAPPRATRARRVKTSKRAGQGQLQISEVVEAKDPKSSLSEEDEDGAPPRKGGNARRRMVTGDVRSGEGKDARTKAQGEDGPTGSNRQINVTSDDGGDSKKRGSGARTNAPKTALKKVIREAEEVNDSGKGGRPREDKGALQMRLFSDKHMASIDHTHTETNQSIESTSKRVPKFTNAHLKRLHLKAGSELDIKRAKNAQLGRCRQRTKSQREHPFSRKKPTPLPRSPFKRDSAFKKPKFGMDTVSTQVQLESQSPSLAGSGVAVPFNGLSAVKKRPRGSLPQGGVYMGKGGRTRKETLPGRMRPTRSRGEMLESGGVEHVGSDAKSDGEKGGSGTDSKGPEQSQAELKNVYESIGRIKNFVKKRSMVKIQTPQVRSLKVGSPKESALQSTQGRPGNASAAPDQRNGQKAQTQSAPKERLDGAGPAGRGDRPHHRPNRPDADASEGPAQAGQGLHVSGATPLRPRHAGREHQSAQPLCAPKRQADASTPRAQSGHLLDEPERAERARFAQLLEATAKATSTQAAEPEAVGATGEAAGGVAGAGAGEDELQRHGGRGASGADE